MLASRLTKSRLLFIIGVIFLLGSCSQMRYFPGGNAQKGLASWYGSEFHGKVTSNKEIYDMHDLTAAHLTLPFGTYVKVTNLDNGKSVVVRINDRGPFVKGRIIDLSYAAATKLGMKGPGVVPVVLEVLKKYSPKKSSQKFFVQVGAFVTKKNAESLKKELLRRYRDVHISVLTTSSQTYYRVRIKASTLEAAEKIVQKLLKEGYDAQVLEEQHFL